MFVAAFAIFECGRGWIYFAPKLEDVFRVETKTSDESVSARQVFENEEK
jgi:hypothetical protein